MKRIILVFFAVGLFGISYGQKLHQIRLTNESMSITDRKFYIDSIIDNRVVTDNIGTVKKGLFNRKHPAVLENGLSNSLQEYFDNSLPPESGHIPITIKVNKFEISEKTTFTDEFGFADLSLEYYHESEQLFNSVQHVGVTSMDVTRLHEENIREALKKSVIEFNNSESFTNDEQEEVTSDTTLRSMENLTAQNALKSNAEHNDFIENRNRNITAIGYQIGGYNLVGIDYEVRLNNFFGIHFGAGFSGYTYGLKIHTNPMKNSSFFNVSFKDGGLGLINAAALEYGGRWVFNKESDFGLHFQFGFARILEIDKDFEEQFFNDEGAPPSMFSMGIGFSW